RDLAHRAALVFRELEREVLLQLGRQLLLERELDSRAGPLGEVPRAGLHQLLIEQLVERETPPARLRLSQVAWSMYRGERPTQLRDPHGGGEARRMRIDGESQQGIEVLVNERADLAVRQAFGRRIDGKHQAALRPRFALVREHHELP